MMSRLFNKETPWSRDFWSQSVKIVGVSCSTPPKEKKIIDLLKYNFSLMYKEFKHRERANREPQTI